jgi:NADH-quinone oxidoreductase subunit H
MFFLGEYGNILLMSSLFVIFFLGGWDFFGVNSEFIFSLKIAFIVFLFVFVRANLPRYRFDQLMVLGWKIFLPLSLGFIFFTSGFLISFNSLKLKQLHLFNYFYNPILI